MNVNVIGQGPLVMGTAQLGLDYGFANESGMPSLEAATTLLREAATAGVSHLDTARVYGVSEQRIGELLGTGDTPRFGVVTKIRPLELPDDCSSALARESVDDSVRRSLAALRRESVDALLLHWAHERFAGGGAVGRRLQELRDAGVCRLAGASIGVPADLISVLDEPWLGYVQLPFNLLDRRWLTEEVQQALTNRPEVIVTVRSVYLQGLLVADRPWPTATGLGAAEATALRRLLAELATDCGLDGVGELAIAYAVSQPWVTSAVVGADSPQQVRETARRVTRRLTPDQMATIRGALPPVPESLLTPGAWIDPNRQGRREAP